MQEHSRYAVGIDVGTTTIRCVVGHIDPTTGTPTIVGVGQAANSGMRKGTVLNLSGPAHAIDAALGDAERMSGYEVNEATISINGAHIISTKADGMIAVGMANHEINHEDLERIEEVATTGKVPANREILEVVPFAYSLDGQGGIKDPVGMSGTRLEISANVISAMSPLVASLQKSAEMATVSPVAMIPSVMAAAKSVLQESQIENGVAVIDLGGATTSVAIFEEGDLQYVGVVPMGGINITNDLAIGLKVDPAVAEQVKVSHATLVDDTSADGAVNVKIDKEIYTFNATEIREIIEARLEEIFELVNKELKRAGRAGQLASGVVLTGGTANIKGVAEYAKSQLGLAARIGKSSGFAGVADNIETPQFATAIGLMLIDSESTPTHNPKKMGGNGKQLVSKTGSMVSRFLGRFKP
mgnify:FL=1